MLVEFILGIFVGFFNWVGSILVVPEPVFVLLRTTVGWLKQLFDMLPKHPLLPITTLVQGILAVFSVWLLSWAVKGLRTVISFVRGG